MKLQNIFLAGLALCAMLSCSKDGDADNGPKAPVDAYISISPSSQIMMRAEATNINGEDYVEELTAFVFRDNTSDKSLAGYKIIEKGTSSIKTIEDIKIKVTAPDRGGNTTPDKFVVVVVANANGKVKNATTLEALKGLFTSEISNYTVNGVEQESVRLPMIGQLEIGENKIQITGEGSLPVENWVGKDEGSSNVIVSTENENQIIYLNRIVSRVDLMRIQVNFKEIEGASFDLTKVFMANVRSTSPISIVANGNTSDFWKGFQSKNFKPVQNLIIPAKNGTEILSGEQTNTTNVKPSLSLDYSIIYKDMKGSETEQSKYVKECNKPLFYIFNNSKESDYQTRLILEGNFKRNAQAPAELKHFHVVLRDPKSSVVEVLPNTVYQLYVNITGEGSPNEDEILSNAYISATIEVAPWYVIEQDEPDVN